MGKSIKKLIALVITTVTLVGTTIIPANAEWKKDNTGWWNAEGNSYSTGWRLVDSKWYYFNPQTGYMQTGWFKDTDGKYYYLQNDGSMAVNITTPDGYKIDDKGIWIQATNSNINTTTTSVKPTNNETKSSSSSSSNTNVSSTPSSNNKSNVDYSNDKSKVTIYYPLSNPTRIDSMCMGVQGLSDEKPSTNSNIISFTKYNYGILIVDASDYGMTSRDMVHNKRNFEIKDGKLLQK